MTLPDQPFPCRLLVDPPAGGAWNMALDEALLEHVAAGDRSVWLRFYEWDQPTLSLGYFQPHAPWREHVRGECAVVRRRTGGGAILHDRELTYSLVLPPRHPLSRRGDDLYTLVHRALIVALSRFGIAAELHGEVERRLAEDEPYLCFLRRAAFDVVVRFAANEPRSARSALDVPPDRPATSSKICGSAQRRSRGALLLHGSLLLATSPAAPQLPGIQETTGVRVPLCDARTAWSRELSAAFGANALQPCQLPPPIRERAKLIEQTRFATTAWTARR